MGLSQLRNLMHRRPEQALQRAMVEYLDAVLTPPAFGFAIPNGGWRSAVEAAILKGQGVRPGIPDVAIVSEGRVYFLELKSPVGRTSPAQRAMHERLIAAGVRVEVVHSLEEVEGCL